MLVIKIYGQIIWNQIYIHDYHIFFWNDYYHKLLIMAGKKHIVLSYI